MTYCAVFPVQATCYNTRCKSFGVITCTYADVFVLSTNCITDINHQCIGLNKLEMSQVPSWFSSTHCCKRLPTHPLRLWLYLERVVFLCVYLFFLIRASIERVVAIVINVKGTRFGRELALDACSDLHRDENTAYHGCCPVWLTAL